MKKFLALIALVAMVAVSSVAYGAAVTVGGTLGSVSSIDGCTATIALSPTSVQTDNCTNAAYVSNHSTGTTVTYTAEAGAVLDASGANPNLVASAPAVLGTDTWSFLTASTDTGCTMSATSYTAPADTGVLVLSCAAPASGNLVLTFAGSVNPLAASGQTYSNAGTITITENP